MQERKNVHLFLDNDVYQLLCEYARQEDRTIRSAANALLKEALRERLGER